MDGDRRKALHGGENKNGIFWRTDDIIGQMWVFRNCLGLTCR